MGEGTWGFESLILITFRILSAPPPMCKTTTQLSYKKGSRARKIRPFPLYIYGHICPSLRRRHQWLRDIREGQETKQVSNIIVYLLFEVDFSLPLPFSGHKRFHCVLTESWFHVREKQEIAISSSTGDTILLCDNWSWFMIRCPLEKSWLSHLAFC